MSRTKVLRKTSPRASSPFLSFMACVRIPAIDRFSVCIGPLVDLSTIANLFSDILQKRPRTPTLKKHAIAYLDSQTKSFDYTREVMCSLERQIREELARLGGNQGLEAIMDKLHVD